MIILYFFFRQEDRVAGLRDFLKNHNAVNKFGARGSKARRLHLKIVVDNLYVTVNKIVLFCWIAPESNAVEEGTPGSLLLPSGLLLVLSQRFILIGFCLLSIVSLLPGVCLRIWNLLSGSRGCFLSSSTSKLELGRLLPLTSTWQCFLEHCRLGGAWEVEVEESHLVWWKFELLHPQS